MSDIGGDAILVAGGARAILLQLANPAVGAGVAAHSTFTTRPLDRLHATLTFCYAQVYGTESDRRVVARRVNAAHGPVTAPAGDSTPAYSAFDPTLQLWVAATLYDTAQQVHELVFGPLDDNSADALYRQYSVIGTALQMPAALWPENRTAFRTWFDREIESFDVSPDAVRVSRQLLTLGAAPFWLRLALPTVRLVTAGLLPARLRPAFGFRWTERQQRRFDRALRIVRVVWPAVPRRIRHFPVRYYLRRLRG